MVDARLKGDSQSDELDQQLQQYAEVAQRHPPQSTQRQLALNRLVNKILTSGRLGHPQRNLWSYSLYEDFYNEALQKTLLEVCQKIDSYNPEHPVMAWVNFRLNHQFIEVVNDCNKKGITQIPKSAKTRQIAYLPSLDQLDKLTSVEETLSDDQLLRQFLEDDPEHLLKKSQIRDRPEITFQSLALAKFVEGQTWSEIATNLEVSVQTLCSFFNRQLKELMPYFRKYLA
ncbi:MAG: sigma-70 family RNA polymerase sigma factor [Cyanobacteria bacterium CRU_2_1]|nr:sigma-70 family RNA polymerase sigma factor [Cyanobacteria bacterium RU_5_0]NJR61642.1 sigma-70 family RNA polymerase sigma factor [Cyanobacteria bacterium CRU_2_1]